MFKRLILVAAAASIASAAMAADVNAQSLPLKAPAPTPCQVQTATTPLSCSGLYAGLGIGGEGSNADIVGSGINGSVFAGGMTPTFTLGYQYASGNWFFGAELDPAYAIGSGQSVNGVGSNTNGLRFTEILKVGGNLSALFGTVAPISIPPQLAAAVIAPYAGIGQTQWQLVGAWANGTVGAAGVVFDIGPNWFGDLRYTYTSFNAAQSQGIKINNDQSLLVTFNRKIGF